MNPQNSYVRATAQAAEIAAALGGGRREGRGWRCRCPLHGGASLCVADGERGRVLVRCFGGCDARDVLAALRRLGLLECAAAPMSPEEIARRQAAEERKRRVAVALALDLWNEGRPIVDTLADRYLRSARGIDVLSPYVGEAAAHVLRLHARCWHSSPRIYRPALLAKIEHVERGFIGCHATYLAPDGSDKTTLEPPRKIFGTCAGGAVRLGEPQRGEWLILGEGVETVLACMQATRLPGWACLSAGGLQRVVLPSPATCIIVAADNDANGVGERAAHAAARRLIAEGRRVKVALPSRLGDFNDVLRGQHAA